MADGAAGNLREELARLSRNGLLREVTRPVDPRFEVTAIARAAEPTALLFRSVGTPAMPVVMNTLASREALASSFGVPVDDTVAFYLRALERPLAPERVTSAPVQELCVTGDEVDLTTLLPVLTHHEDDAGPYITTGVAVAEDRARTIRNLSYHRMQVKSARRTGMVVVQRHLHAMLEEYDAHGEPMPVAIVLGLDSATRLAAATSGSATPYGFDELAIAGGLHGRPVPMVPGVTIPIDVPAEAEIVIEGHILPNTVEDEGPFAEFDGTYESDPGRVFEASAVTMRRGAIYQGLRSGSVEQLNIMGLPNEPVILRGVRAVVPTVRSVRVTRGGLRKFHAVISLEKRTPGDPFDAVVAAFAAHRDLKTVVVVDADVSPFDALAVETAVATYFQPATDLLLVGRGRGNPVDRSLAPDGTTSRMGLDATRPPGVLVERSNARIPGVDDVDLSHYLADPQEG